MKTFKEHQKTVTDQVIGALNHGVPPWCKSWTDDGSTNSMILTHRNGDTGHIYTGINWIVTMLSPFDSNEWFTKNQLVKLTGKRMPIPYDVFLNEGTPIVYYNTASKVVDGKEEFYPVRRLYVVWNRDQIEDLPPSKFDNGHEMVDPQTEVEKYLANLDLKGGVHRGGDQACFVPAKDCVLLPNDDAFENVEERESTKAHEGIHATGAKHRLDRKKESYAEEELVAELGAAMVCASLGIPLEKLRHTSYIQAWLKRLNDDQNFIFKAAAEASKAAQYLTQEHIEKAA